MTSSDRLQTSAAMSDAYYDVHYYMNYAGGQSYTRDNPVWQAFFGNLADRIVTDFGPGTVLDAGCSVGVLVEALRGRGVEGWGIDISTYAIDHVREDMKPFCSVLSLTDELDRDYDLIVCIEVLEHLAPAAGQRAIANFARHADVVLFSSTPEEFGDPSHLNVQPSDYWVALFGAHQMYREVEYDATYVTPHAFVVRRSRDAPIAVLRAYERANVRLKREVAEVRSANIALVRELNELHTLPRAGRRLSLKSRIANVARRARVWLRPRIRARR